MDNTHNYLQVLSESLDKKLVILNELQKLTDSQRELAQKEELDTEAYDAAVESKEILIEELQKLDGGFQLLYDNISNQISNNRQMYAGEIKILQAKIKLVLDKSTSLQVAENHNKELISSKFASMRKEIRQVRKSRNTAASYYKTMNNITSEAYFLDQKK